MNCKQVFLLMLISILVCGYAAGQSSPSTEVDRLLNRLQNADEGPERVNILNNLCREYRSIDLEKALKYGKQGLELAEKIKFQEGIATCSNSIAITYKHKGDHQQALKYDLKNLKIREELGDKKGIALIYNNMGLTYKNMGKYDQALRQFSKSLEIKEQIGDKGGISDSYTNMGITYAAKGIYTLALEHHLKSLKISENINDKKSIASTYDDMGHLYLKQGDYQKGLEYLTKSSEINQKLGAKSDIADYYNTIGQMYLSQGKYDQALDFQLKGLKIREELGEKITTAGTYRNIGFIYLKQSHFQKALEFYSKSRKADEQGGDVPGLANSYFGIACCYKAMGKNQQALGYLNRALKIGREINSPEIVRNTAKELSEVYAEKKQYQRAYYYHVLFKETNDSLKKDESIRKLNQLEMQYEAEKIQEQQKIEQKKEEMAEQAEQAELKQQRLITYAFSGFGLLLFLVFYTRYHLKARTARQLQKEIDQRKITEGKLRASEEMFRVLAEKSVVGICIVQDELLKYVNPRFLELFQYSSEELIGKRLLDLVVEEDRPTVLRKYEKRKIGMADSIPFEYRAFARNGHIIHLEARGILTNYEGKPAILETLIDISDRKKVEAELLKSRKLESIGILAGGIAHDFNNLLAVLVGNLSLAKMNINEPNPQLENYVDQAEMVSSQAAKLVKQFLTLSKGSWITKELVTLPDILKDAANASALMKEIPYTTSVPNDLKALWGDRHQLRQVFINLLLNAYEATSGMKKERIITISAKNIRLESDNKWELEEGEYVKISLRDNGKGIPAQLLENIFDPYFSTKERDSHKGTGLGLTLCYAIVKKHDGHISVSSELRKGTAFEIYLPVYSVTKHGQVEVSS